MFENMKIRYFLILTIVLSISVELVLPLVDTPANYGRVISDFVSVELVAILFFGTYFFRQKTPLQNVVTEKNVDTPYFSVLALALIFNTFSITTYWGYFVIEDSFFSLDPFIITPSTESVLFLIVTMVLSVIAGPIAEEFIFRGLLLNRLIKKTNMWAGILISSLAFAASHMKAEQLLATFLFGVMASLIYLKTKNLFIPILVHIVYNALTNFQTSFFPGWVKALFLTSSDDLYVNVVLKSSLLLISTVLIIGVIVKLAKDLRANKKKDALLPQPEVFLPQPETISSQ